MAKKNMGWVPDYPDVQDFKLDDKQVVQSIQKNKLQGVSETERTENQVSNQISTLVDILNSLKDAVWNDCDQQLDSKNQNTINKLTALSKEIEQQSSTEFNFLSATFLDDVLLYGSSGKEVEDLQNRLYLLGYYDPSTLPKDFHPSGYFDQDTENAVKKFQEQQQLSVSGIVTGITQAELAAMAAIAAKDFNYGCGDTGLGVVFLQQMLLTLNKNGTITLSSNLHESFVDGKYGPSTVNAVTAFQKHEQLSDADGIGKADGIVGSRTTNKLKESFESPLLKLLQAPISRKNFENIADVFISVLLEDSDIKQSVDTYVKDTGKEIRDIFFPNIYPLVEVVAQLIPFLPDETNSKHTQLTRIIPKLPESGQYTDEDKKDKATLREVLKKGYDVIQKTFQDGPNPDLVESSNPDPVESKVKSPPPVVTNLSNLAVRLSRQRGYISSNVLEFNKTYRTGNSDSAVIYLQERLRALGYYNAPITGYFEQLTEDAVKKLQRSLSKTNKGWKELEGIVSQDTMGFLYQDRSTREQFKFLAPPIASEIIESVIKCLLVLVRPEAIKFIKNSTDLQHPKDLKDFIALIMKDIMQEIKKIMQDNKTMEAVDTSSQTRDQLKEIVKQIHAAIPRIEIDEFEDSETIEQIVSVMQDLNSSEGTSDQDEEEAARKLLFLLVGQFIRPIVKLVVQVISPVGKYSDLDKAVEAGLKKIKSATQSVEAESIETMIKALPLPVEWQYHYQPIDHEHLEDYKPNIDAVLQALTTSSLDEFNVKESKLQPLFNKLQLLFRSIQHGLKGAFPGLSSNQDNAQTLLTNLLNELNHRAPVLKPLFDGIQARLSDIISSKQDYNLSSSGRTVIRLEPPQGTLQAPISASLKRQLDQAALTNSQAKAVVYLVLPPSVDLSIWCSPVEDQGSIDACTAHAGVALIEYFERKSFGKHIDASRRFLYKVTRDLMQRSGDTGASVRETMKAMVLFGVPPEEYCPYSEAEFDDDPSAFCFAFAQSYQAIKYFRLDHAGMSTQALLAQIKIILVAGFPCMFGFTVYDSIYDPSNVPGHIPFPDKRNDQREGGHATVAVGYDDYKQVKNATRPGAILIKNSWGKGWGDGGYGWLPYDYVLEGLARDWWSLIKSEWVESQQFGLGSPDAWTANLGFPTSGSPH